MITINRNYFLEELADKKIIKNVTTLCAKCYKEFKEEEVIFYDIENLRYICKNCACCLSEELETKAECTLQECEEPSLFAF